MAVDPNQHEVGVAIYHPGRERFICPRCDGRSTVTNFPERTVGVFRDEEGRWAVFCDYCRNNRVLTRKERQEIYNAGEGLSYSELFEDEGSGEG